MSIISAKAINSTLGTNEFKSLDEILDSWFRLVISDNIFYIYDDEIIKTTTEAKTKLILFTKGGTVRFNISGTYKSGSSESVQPVITFSIIDETENIIAQASQTVSGQYGSATWSTYLDANIEPNKKYYIKGTGYVYSANTSLPALDSVSVLGTVVFGNAKCEIVE